MLISQFRFLIMRFINLLCGVSLKIAIDEELDNLFLIDGLYGSKQAANTFRGILSLITMRMGIYV